MFYCASHIFWCIFWKEKKIKQEEKENRKAWILLNQMRTEKQMHAAALRHRIFVVVEPYVLHQLHSNCFNSDFSFHRYHAGRDRDLCLQDACWDNALYPFTRAFQGDDFQYSLAVTLITLFFSVGYIVLTQPWLHFPWNDNSISIMRFTIHAHSVGRIVWS